MTTTVDDVISFSRLILHGSSQNWGGIWTQREIDGFFYNQFLNLPLHSDIRQARRQSLGQENPPYPCDWMSPEAQESMIEPWGNGGSLNDLDEYFLGGSDPQVAYWYLGGSVDKIHERFCLIESTSAARWCTALRFLSNGSAPFLYMVLTAPFSGWWFIASRLANRSKHGLSGNMTISGSGWWDILPPLGSPPLRSRLLA